MKNIIIPLILFSNILIAFNTSLKSISIHDIKANKEQQKHLKLEAEKKEVQNAVAQFDKKTKNCIDNHFGDYWKTSCRNAEFRSRPFQDCSDYFDFKSPIVARDTMQKIDVFTKKLADNGVSKKDCNEINQRLKNNVTIQILENTEKLFHEVSHDTFAYAHMKGITLMALDMNDIMNPNNENLSRSNVHVCLTKTAQQILNAQPK